MIKQFNPLRPEHNEAGIFFVPCMGGGYLMRDGVILMAVSETAPIKDIQHEADQLMEWARSGIAFEPVEGHS